MKRIRKKTFLLILGLVILVLLLVLGGVTGARRKAKGSSSTERLVTVLIRPATTGSLEQYLDLHGRLEARNEVQVYPDVPGKIARIVKYEGTSVAKGDPILYVDRSQVGSTYVLAPVRSPVSGTVTTLLVNTGQQISPQMPVAGVGDLSVMNALINVPEQSAPEIANGQKILLKSSALPDRVFTGEIYRKDLTVDPLSHTLLVRGRFLNPTRELLSGMYVDLSILIRRADGVFVLPNTAVFREDGKSFVYLDRTNTAFRQEVETLFSARDQVAVKSGLRVGDRVVVFGREFLTDGIRINPIDSGEED